eukprot:scaffold6671_cov376-Prasinococcus_capsulatus_cf.AAC.3
MRHGARAPLRGYMCDGGFGGSLVDAAAHGPPKRRADRCGPGDAQGMGRRSGFWGRCVSVRTTVGGARAVLGGPAGDARSPAGGRSEGHGGVRGQESESIRCH